MKFKRKNSLDEIVCLQNIISFFPQKDANFFITGNYLQIIFPLI